MSRSAKITLLILGILTAVSTLGQLVLGLLIANGRVNLRTAHQHSGYTTVALILAYVVLSLILALKTPTRSSS